MSDSLFEIALRLLASGFSVVPSGGGEDHKHPLYPWKEYQKRLPDRRELENWQYKDKPRLWGIVCGAVSKLVVVDADTPQARAGLEKELGKPHIGTPRGGGHWYFKYPGHRVKTTAGILQGIDIRADGGFVNTVGSRPDGEYQVLTLPSPDNLLPWDRLPKRIFAGLNGKPATGESHLVLGELIPRGKQNTWLFLRASGYRRHGDTEEVIFQKLKLDLLRCDQDSTNPFTDKDLRTIAKSACRYEPGPAVPPITKRRNTLVMEVKL
jgi:hypothetical protein